MIAHLCFYNQSFKMHCWVKPQLLHVKVLVVEQRSSVLRSCCPRGAALFCCSGALPAWQIFHIWAAAAVVREPCTPNPTLLGCCPFCQHHLWDCHCHLCHQGCAGAPGQAGPVPCGSCPPQAQGHHPRAGCAPPAALPWRDLLLQPRFYSLG